MALALKLRETMAFEEKAGVPFNNAIKRLSPQFCQLHRLARGKCADCKKDGVCAKHLAEFQECVQSGDCEMPQIPAMQLAALGWIVKRRDNPELDWETYIDEAGPDDAWLALGNLQGIQATD